MIHTFAAKIRNVTHPCDADVTLSVPAQKTGRIKLDDRGHFGGTD